MLAAEAARPGRGFSEAGVSVASCHPGVVTSPLLKNLGMTRGYDTAEAGAALPLQLAIGPPPPASTPNGAYFADKKSPAKLCKFGSDAQACKALWAACEGLIAAKA